jgi:basic membrane protein A
VVRVRRNVRRSLAVLAAVVTVAALAACAPVTSGGSSGGSSANPTSVATSPKVKAAMVTDVAGLGDQAMNDLSYAGLQRAHSQLGVDVKVLVSKTVTDYQSNLSQLAQAGYSPIFSVGLLMTDAVTKESTTFPNVAFGGIDEDFAAPAPNLVGLDFKMQEGAYLAGVVAGLSTKAKFDSRLNSKNVIAFIGSMKIPTVQAYEAGFVAGAKSVDPTVKVISLYAGSFDDQAKGCKLGLSAIASGADVVFAAAGQTGLGVEKACADSKKALFIGADTDQSLTIAKSSDVILTSAVKRVDNAVFMTVQEADDKTLTGGQNVFLGLKDDAVGLAPFHDFDSKVPQSIKDAVAKATAAIRAGSITVPATP